MGILKGLKRTFNVAGWIEAHPPGGATSLLVPPWPPATPSYPELFGASGEVPLTGGGCRFGFLARCRCYPDSGYGFLIPTR